MLAILRHDVTSHLLPARVRCYIVVSMFSPLTEQPIHLRPVVILPHARKGRCGRDRMTRGALVSGVQYHG